MSPHYGRSEVTRTPGILLPKQARYQLRYTPIVIKLWSCKWSKLWSNTVLTAFYHFPNRPKSARLKGFLRFSLSCGAKTAYAPKAGAIAKLRYTSMILNYYMITAVKVALVALLQNRRTVRLRSHCSFCCASSSSLHLPQAALAFVTQSRCDSQTSQHLDAFYCPVILI